MCPQVERERGPICSGSGTRHAHAVAHPDVEHDAVGCQALLLGHGRPAPFLGGHVTDQDRGVPAFLDDLAPCRLCRLFIPVDADDRSPLVGARTAMARPFPIGAFGSRERCVPAPITVMERPSRRPLTPVVLSPPAGGDMARDIHVPRIVGPGDQRRGRNPIGCPGIWCTVPFGPQISSMSPKSSASWALMKTPRPNISATTSGDRPTAPPRGP